MYGFYIDTGPRLTMLNNNVTFRTKVITTSFNTIIIIHYLMAILSDQFTNGFYRLKKKYIKRYITYCLEFTNYVNKWL